MPRFKVIKKSKVSNARLGRITTPHGTLATPFFMPDATRAVVKSLSAEDLMALGLEAAVVNTYHLYLQPGEGTVKKLGGVHAFMQFDRPLLSDSGGFQVFSLIHKNPALGKIHEDKVVFRTPENGDMHELTPERSIRIQFDLGTDMMVVLDDCPPYESTLADIQAAIRHTTAWALRCKKEYDRQVKRRKLTEINRPLLFGVIQGGLSVELRERAARELLAIGFDGYGFGGRPIDKDGKFREDVLGATARAIGENVPRFGLGIGTPDDIVRCARLGWDMFDCVIPTREGRHGRLFYWRHIKNSVIASAAKQSRGKTYVQNSRDRHAPLRSARDDMFKGNFYTAINITNAKYTNDHSPINAASRLPELRTYSKGYLHHLLKINEPLGWRLASLHNLEFYLDLMRRVRTAIRKGEL